MKKLKPPTFTGFEAANTTPVPDVLFDELLSTLTGAELKVLLYIIRRTWGFKKDTDAVSLTQFQEGIVTKEGKRLDYGCGVRDRQTIIDALNTLEEMKCIISDKGKTASGDNATTAYRIYFSQQSVVGKTNHRSKEKPTTVVDFSNHRSREMPTTLVGNSNPQETVIQQTDLQETVTQEDTYVGAVAQHAPTPALAEEIAETRERLEDQLEEIHDRQAKGATDAVSVSDSQHLPPRPELVSSGVGRNGVRGEEGGVNGPLASPNSSLGVEKPPKGRGRKDVTQADPSAPPEMPPPDMAWGTRKCLLRFDALRGVTLISRHKLMQASQCAKGLAERYSEAYTFLAQEIMSDDRYYAGRFVDVCDVANNIHKYKAKIEKRLKEQAPPSNAAEDDLSQFGHSDFDSYVGNGPEERKREYERALARLAAGTLIE